jgi:hypothetical protein
MEIVGASTSGGAAHTKQPSLLLLDKKPHVFEIAWIVARKGAKCPIFEGETPPKKMYPQYWRRYRRHNRNPVNSFHAIGEQFSAYFLLVKNSRKKSKNKWPILGQWRRKKNASTQNILPTDGDSIPGLFHRTSPGFTTAPQVKLHEFLYCINIFSIYFWMFNFLLAFTRAGFDSQLTLNYSLH